MKLKQENYRMRVAFGKNFKLRKDDIKMIEWISADTPPAKCDFSKEYLVTCEYNGLGNTNGRKTFVMTYDEKGRKKIPTWCWKDRIAAWKVLFWSEFPEPCQDEI